MGNGCVIEKVDRQLASAINPADHRASIYDDMRDLPTMPTATSFDAPHNNKPYRSGNRWEALNTLFGHLGYKAGAGPS
jgi:hypothetical protein